MSEDHVTDRQDMRGYTPSFLIQFCFNASHLTSSIIYLSHDMILNFINHKTRDVVDIATSKKERRFQRAFASPANQLYAGGTLHGRSSLAARLSSLVHTDVNEHDAMNQVY